MGMDGLNNAVIPGYATPEQYTKEITIANDGVVNQTTVYAYAKHSFTTIQQLDQWGIKFEKDETGEFCSKKVHHMGAYVLPMPEGHDVKKVLYRQLKRAQVKINNRIVTTKLLKMSKVQSMVYSVLIVVVVTFMSLKRKQPFYVVVQQGV